MGGVITMRYNSIVLEDIANGDGVGVSLYVQGCSKHCPGCFNPETWDFNAGFAFTEKEQEFILSNLAKPYINHFSILGGEPLEEQNLQDLTNLIMKIRDTFPHIKIWLWTGYEYNELFDKQNNEYLNYILKNINFLIEGPFIQEQKDLTLLWRGSKNQKVWMQDPQCFSLIKLDI